MEPEVTDKLGHPLPIVAVVLPLETLNPKP